MLSAAVSAGDGCRRLRGSRSRRLLREHPRHVQPARQGVLADRAALLVVGALALDLIGQVVAAGHGLRRNAVVLLATGRAAAEPLAGGAGDAMGLQVARVG